MRNDLAAFPSEPSDGLSIDQAVQWATEQARAGRLEDAESMCMSILGEVAPVHALLGSILAHRGDHAAAVTFLSAASAMRPESADVRVALSRALYRCARWTEALAAAEAAVSLSPESAAANDAAGSALLQLGLLDAAVQRSRRATELEPGRTTAWVELGNALGKQGRLSEAAAAFEKAVELCPDEVGAWGNLASALLEQGRILEGQAAAERALELSPDAVAVNANALFFTNVAAQEAAREVFAKHRVWGTRLAELAAPYQRAHANSPEPNRRLRVGYVSGDFRGEGGVASFIEPLLTSYDRQAFEVTCYSTYPRGDATTARLRGYVDRWRPVDGRPVEAIAELVRQDGIDVLVDLAGYTFGSLSELFARKPAPVQVTYLGYPNTTGLPTIDYRITDALADPVGRSEAFHTERLVRPFPSFLCYEPASDAPEVQPPPSEQRGYVTFGSFNHRRKINEAVIDAWAAVLRAVPGSRLRIKAQALVDSGCRRRLGTAFETRGVAVERLDLVALVPSHRDHLEAYRDVDIALDTFPYTGTTTTCEALWMGVPVVTRAGQTHRSRVSFSILENVGLGELAASSPEEFVLLAKELAEDRHRLRQLRFELRSMMRRSPLMDATGFGRALGKAYRDMWQQWCRSVSAHGEPSLVSAS